MIEYVDGPPRLQALVPQARPLNTELEKRELLVRLPKGNGVTVYTSPARARYWAIASSAVSIVLIPEFVEYKERISAELWAAYAAGYRDEQANLVVKRKSPPTRGQLVGLWNNYDGILHEIQQNILYALPIVDAEKVELIAPTRYTGQPTVSALDWEWVKNRPSLSVGLAISDAENNYYLPVRAQDVAFLDDNERAAREIFASYLQSPMPTVLHGGRADISTQYPRDPIELVGSEIDDTLLMAYVLDPNIPDLSLKLMAPKFLNERAIPYPGDTERLTAQEAGSYAAGSDTRLTYKLSQHLKSQLIEKGLWKVYNDIEKPLVPIVSSMEKVGVPVDIPKVVDEYRTHVAIEYGIRRFFEDNWGPISTSAQARQTLSKILGFDPGTVDQRKISKYREGEIDLYLLFTTTRTRRRNFLGSAIKKWHAAGKPSEFRLYPRFNQAGGDESSGSGSSRAPRTGRFSSSGPNFQQQPRPLRHIYIPPVGHLWWKWDYGQLELRLAANLSNDTNLISDIKSGQPHRKFQAEIEAVAGYSVDYYVAKTANFEKLYFGGDRQLITVLQKDRVFIDAQLARGISIAHKNRYEGWYRYAQGYVDHVKHDGWIARTPNNRSRYIGELRSRDPETYSHGTRAAVNHRVQGWAADIVKMTMRRVAPILIKYGAHMALTVHDELCGWIDKNSDIENFKKEMVQAMTSWELGPVPLVVEGGVGESWAGPFN